MIQAQEIIWTKKTCLCPFVRCFGTLFWDDVTIFWDENYVNKLLIGPKQFFFSVKNNNKFSSQNNSPNIVRKGHELF